MHNFEDIVKRCYQKNSDEEISNGSIKHAKILADYLFRYAKEKNKDIKIVTGSLDGGFYNNFSDIVKEILTKNKVSIISEKPYEDSSFSQEIKKSANGTIKIIGKDDKVTSLPHFILIGDCAYRLETDDRLKLATASFNRPSIGQFLSDIFDRFK
ncbi:hypothetical protein BSPWISOX_2041 [uncultured Gammaproteobacteria bacterium]|nr:hypothetical protein BSPWISOX_2041 [uncultured Gammaproteobacteria bacterium]